MAIGTALRKLFGEARAVRAEEAASQGVVIINRARLAFEQEKGRPITAAEFRKMHEAYVANLRELGFVQNDNGMWYRPRSAIERILG